MNHLLTLTLPSSHPILRVLLDAGRSLTPAHPHPHPPRVSRKQSEEDKARAAAKDKKKETINGWVLFCAFLLPRRIPPVHAPALQVTTCERPSHRWGLRGCHYRVAGLCHLLCAHPDSPVYVCLRTSFFACPLGPRQRSRQVPRAGQLGHVLPF